MIKNNKKSRISYPSISCVIATFNSSASINECLQSLTSQDYPKNKIEIIIIDGGSSDNTLKIVHNYKVKLYAVPKNKQEAEYNKGVGVSHAKNELILLIDHDNVLPNKQWLKKMVKPLIEHNELIGSEVARFNYNPKDYILDRYFALIGGIDPVPYYLGKDSKLSWSTKKYNLLGKSEDCGDYYIVTFSRDKIPTLGANGTIIRRNLLKHAKADPEHFFHIDIFHDLIRKGFNKYAFVKEDIIHYKRTRISYFIKFLIRRKDIMEKQYFENLEKRRYAVYVSKTDKWQLIKYIIYSITFVKPTYDALRGFIVVRDVAWFLHPVICFSFLVVYSWAVIARQLRKLMV